jgi:predicted nucleic acid-binding protein
MTQPRVYLETTIISYATASPSCDLLRAARQHITREWWQRRDLFDLYVSQAVLQEAAAGEAEAAARRLVLIQGIAVLEVIAEVGDLAGLLVSSCAVPAKAALDAAHIAIAAVHGMDYLLTWNCKHIANVRTRVKIEQACRQSGFQPPLICTPEELTEE